MSKMTELQFLEKWLPEYFAKRHKTWPLRNDADLTPTGVQYCKSKMRQLIRRTIAQIRELREDAK